MNEVNLLAVALTASNSADSLEALQERLSKDHIERIEEAVNALRSLSFTLVDEWLSMHPDAD